MKAGLVWASVLLVWGRAHGMIGDEEFEKRRTEGRKLQFGNSYIAKVRANQNRCDAIKAEIDEIKAIDLMRGGEDELSEKIEVAEECFVEFKGTETLADIVRSMTDVLYVERNGLAYINAPKSWGLDRVDQKNLPLNKRPFDSPFTGDGVSIYVIDTGINKQHVDFGSRSVYGKNLADKQLADGNGHGTHCAGTAAGSTYGIARDSKVFGVKVLDSSGSGSWTDVIKGIQWATRNATRSSVLSLSLGGGPMKSIDDACRAAARAGHIVVVASGNDSRDGCKYSPARAGGNAANGGVISVGSTDSRDRLSSFSNFGRCTDIYAPGTSITSAWKGSRTAKLTISGTSMATPHVAGVAALLLEKHSFNKAAAQSELLALAVSGKISGLAGKSSKNLLLQVPKYTGPPTPPTLSPTLPPTNPAPSVCVDKATGGQFCVPDFRLSTFSPELKDTEMISGTLANTEEDPIMCKPTREDFKNKIVIVKRGDCYFFDKVDYLQKQGAKAVIIQLVTNEALFTPEAVHDLKTKIPSMLVSQATAIALKKHLGQEAHLGPKGLTAAPTPPTNTPTHFPSRAPTTGFPSRAPTGKPSFSPTPFPTPTPRPTQQERVITARPTRAPTSQRPSLSPTKFPSKAPTNSPTNRPTRAPVTKKPSAAPTRRPTKNPTNLPTTRPTRPRRGLEQVE